MNITDNHLNLTKKTNKRLTEKCRRERINRSLLQLKTLVLRGTNKEVNVKLDKADVMDMAVRYIEDIQQKQLTKDSNKENLAMTSFVQGCSSCINEVSKFLSCQCVNDDFRYDISNHLSTSQCTHTTGLYHQDITSSESYPTISLSRVSGIADDRMTTSTPYKFPLTDDNSRHPFSPTDSVYTLNSASPDNTRSPNYSEYTSNLADIHMESVSSESSVDSSSVDSTVWRPW